MRPLLPTFLLLASVLVAQAAPQIEAQLQPSEIGLGESARLTVTLSGATSKTPPELPEVDGLNFQAAGQSSQISIINGETSSSIGFTYRVTAERTGEFEIPAIPPRTPRAEALKLQVERDQQGRSQPTAGNPGDAPGDHRYRGASIPAKWSARTMANVTTSTLAS